MAINRWRSRITRPSANFILLCVLLGLLCVAGGASREEVIGQLVVRSAAWLTLITVALLGDTPHIGRAPVPTWLLLATIGLALVQIVPLPPALWQALPGRSMLAEAATASGQSQPWRPLAIVPGAALNALGSLVVPAATLVLMLRLTQHDQRRVPGLILILVGTSMPVALLQISGSGVDNPLVNDDTWQVSGFFANRNHFALFMALGILVLPAWVSRDEKGRNWRAPIALGSAPLLMLTILATGSRAGLMVGGIALSVALFLSWRRLTSGLRRRPRWMTWAIATTLGIAVAGFLLISILAGRAVAIDRLFAIDNAGDIRSRARPVVITMIRDYFPVGGGLGGFNPLFRLHEPFELLKPTYFNHAHNDYLELVLDAGLPGLMLIVTAIGWWAFAGVRAWRARDPSGSSLAPTGASMILLVLAASAVDYPARTPMIMALTVIAAVWLGAKPSAALPLHDRPI